MTDKEARRILLDIADQMPSDVCADWIDAVCIGVKAIDAQLNRCDSCTHSEEQDGSNCYECVKGMADNFEAQATDLTAEEKEIIDAIHKMGLFRTNYANDKVSKAVSKIIKAYDTQPMRDATEEERKSVKDYVESISKPTGVQFDAQLTDAKETIIKSALKYLVKMQIEEGSVGFAVDNDPDHDCCWDDILAWLEGSTYGDVSWADIRKAYIKGYEYGVKDWFESKTQPSKDCISRESVTEWLKDKDIIKTKNQEENARKELAELPSVTPSYNSIKTELKPCENCVSRDSLNDAISELTYWHFEDGRLVVGGGGIKSETVYKVDDVVRIPDILPPVKPKYTDEEIDRAQAVEQAYVDKMVELAVEETKRPKGRWIECKSRFGVEYYKCSECGRRLDWIDSDDNYCSNCGSDNSESIIEWIKDRDTKLAEINGGGEE